jgi:hypothetical protein
VKPYQVTLRTSFHRAGADDKPLRMVKTLLHELVKLRGTAIKGHLSLVPIDLDPQPIILAYIDLNLQVQTLGTVGQSQWTAESNGSSSPSSDSAESQLKVRPAYAAYDFCLFTQSIYLVKSYETSQNF